MIVARNVTSAKKNRRHIGIGKAAITLGVERTHLWRVITGQRSSRALLKRYRALKRQGGAK